MSKQQTTRNWWAVGLALVLIGIVATAPVLAQPNYKLPRAVMSSGGDASSGSGSYRLSGTLGQPVAGPVGAASGAGLSSGFWEGRPGKYNIYLPLVLRNH